MATLTSALDAEREQAHQARNRAHTVILTTAMTGLLGLCAFAIWSWLGAAIAVALSIGVMQLAPRVPPETVVRLYRGQPLDARHGAQILHIRDELTARARLPAPPALFVVPSLTLNAFSVGTPERSAIAVTEGLLRKLSLRELAAVLAHEFAHVANNDLKTMAFADVMTRVMQAMSWVAIALAFYHLPGVFTGDAGRTPWLGIGLLYLAPTLTSLLQLALSRTREFDADLDSVVMTGDPEGLAVALGKIEQYEGHVWEDLLPPGTRRIPQPSIFRSHPTTAKRIERLHDIALAKPMPQLGKDEEPMVTLIGLGPASMTPRYRVPGVWF